MEEPEPTNEPPQPFAYHFQLAPVPKEPPPTLKVVAPPHVVLGLAVANEGEDDCTHTGAYVNVIVALDTHTACSFHPPLMLICKQFVPP